MRCTSLVALLGLFLATAGFAQSTSTETNGMQALVAEVRLLRKDLQTTNAYAVKAQIFLNRLQIQEGAASRASQRLSDLRAAIAAIQDRQRKLMAALKYSEKAANDSDLSPAERKDAEGRISGLKAELESVSAEEQERNNAKMEADDQLRAEQAKLATLEQQLDRLERDLDNPR